MAGKKGVPGVTGIAPSMDNSLRFKDFFKGIPDCPVPLVTGFGQNPRSFFSRLLNAGRVMPSRAAAMV